ncbi:MAG: radical SAM protein [Magnetococcales bacterium]|nr:radical SAM protein [Magnetococcales bacterium]MBF0321372.1 radical SAM protein [Magnetococcales bacterium]
MKVVFVEFLNVFNDQHGIYSLSATLKENGIDVDYIKRMNPGRSLSRIIKNPPDVILYSSFTSSIQSIMDFDKKVKEILPDIKSVVGGHGVTFEPTAVSGSTIDAVCIGEGELVLPEFLLNGFQPIYNIFLNGMEPSTQYAPLVNPDELPFPDRDIIYNKDSLLRDLPSKQFFSGRGCPYRCTYCFNHQFNDMFKENGPIIRKKSVDYLLEEIRIIKGKYPLINVHFNDDTFIINKKWFFEFCERFPKLGLTYSCNVRANLVNEEIAEALRASNCLNVTWSIESGNDHHLQKTLKRAMTKKHILNASAYLHKHEIPFRTANLIGLPGETFDEMQETVEINIKAKPSLALANIFIPYPGVELTRYSIEKGFFNKENKLPRNYFTRSPLNFTKDEQKVIIKTFHLFPVFVKFPFLFYRKIYFNLLYALPKIILYLVYEFFYTLGFARWYAIKTSLRLKIRMAIRYALYY